MNPLEAAMNSGDELFKKNIFEEAALSYLRAAELAQDNTIAKVAALLRAGDCQLKNDPAKAKETFSQILINQVSSEQETVARVMIAQCFLADGEFDSAITSTTQILNLPEINREQLAEVYCIRGESFFRLKQFSLAIECFEKALASKALTSTQTLRIYSFMGSIYVDSNRMTPQSAHEKFVQMEKSINAKDSLAWFGVINALTNSLQFKESNEICQQILKNTPNDVEKKYASIYQAKNLFYLKRYDDAAKAYEKLYSQYPDLSEQEKVAIKLELAYVYMHNKKYHDALETFKQVLKFNEITCSPRAQLMIGHCYFELKDFHNALNAFRQVTIMPTLKHQFQIIEEAKQKIVECEKNLK